MINVIMHPDGSVELSHQTPDEVDKLSPRLSMEVSGETQQDLQNEQEFKNGWDSLMREVQLHYVQGTLESFFQSMGEAARLPRAITIDLDNGAWLNQPMLAHGEGVRVAAAVLPGMPEEEIAKAYHDWLVGDRYVDPDIASPLDAEREPVLLGEIPLFELDGQDGGSVEHRDSTDLPTKVSTDTGEQGVTAPNAGMWTMSDEELQSRLDETYNRGLRDGQVSLRKTSRATLERIAEETHEHLAAGADEEIERPVWLTAFAIALAERLGFEVAE